MSAKPLGIIELLTRIGEDNVTLQNLVERAVFADPVLERLALPCSQQRTRLVRNASGKPWRPPTSSGISTDTPDSHDLRFIGETLYRESVMRSLSILSALSFACEKVAALR